MHTSLTRDLPSLKRKRTSDEQSHLRTTSAKSQDLSSVSSTVAFSGYFERQVQARCGLHALNNAIGGPMFNVDDMTSARKAYLAELHREGITERREDHEKPNGWYSAEIMAFVIEAKFTDHRLDHCDRIHFDATNPIQIETASRIYDPQVCGIIVNKDEAHWVTFRLVDNHIWLLDSELEPQIYTFPQYLEFLKRYRNAFAIS